MNLLLHALCTVLCLPLAAGASTAPHIFLVLIDDLGFANVGNRAGGGNGSTIPAEAQTPNIDALTKAGIRLNRHYTYNYCSPSRASLQSGRLPMHVSFNNDDPTTHNPSDPVSGFAGIPRDMTGLAEKLKSAGYATHMTGKWDAGMATWQHTPMGRGYDTFFGYYHHANDYYDQKLSLSSTGSKDVCQKSNLSLVDLWRDQGPANTENSTLYEELLFSNNTLRIIKAHPASEPLFLFHSFHLIHTPLEVPQAYQDKFKFLLDKHRRLYSAMVNFMDEQLGLFVEALKSKGMWDDTLMVVSSDNGGPIYATGITDDSIFGGATNMPLKGGKLSDWEGGVRVNAFVSGGAVPEEMRGEELDQYVHIADWYATLCHLAGVNATDERAARAGLPAVDSINQWPVLSGAQKAAQRTDIYLSEKSYIRGEYKLITGSTIPITWGNSTPGFVNMAGYWHGYGPRAALNTFSHQQNCTIGCLYNIIQDPYEYNDLASTEPELLAQMWAELKELNKGIFLPDRGNESFAACQVGLDKYGGFYGPFVA